MIDETPIRGRYGSLRASLDERERRLYAGAEARSAGHGGVAAGSRASQVARSTLGRGLKDLRQRLEPATMGDPGRLLRWVSKSHGKLASALVALGHAAGKSSIPKLLEQLDYCRHINRKTKEGSHHPDRNAQVEHIDAQAQATRAAGEPVISVDTKKKELIGDFENAGSDYGPVGKPIEVDTHDFENKELGKVVPYGTMMSAPPSAM